MGVVIHCGAVIRENCMFGQQVTIGGRSHILGRARGDDLVQDLMDRGLIACTATDAHDAAHRVLHSIWNEWGMSVLKEGE